MLAESMGKYIGNNKFCIHCNETQEAKGREEHVGHSAVPRNGGRPQLVAIPAGFKHRKSGELLSENVFQPSV